MNELVKPRQRFINAVTNKPVDINPVDVAPVRKETVGELAYGIREE